MNFIKKNFIAKINNLSFGFFHPFSGIFLFLPNLFALKRTIGPLLRQKAREFKRIL
ncbi:unknown protein [Simkania negevensis Z]|uniref:Uncharacterized protein n=1 Tax=Simkania negevensis (strain ATCC VR-1471 / DSM 27360 / Z) TaxID=331113 RepID=F8L962_SIMNZ|nr:unknown protein [Simkania negevensis Z]